MTQTPFPPLPGAIPPPPIGGPGATPAPFRDAGPLGRLTVALLIVDVGMAIALVGSTLSEIHLLDRAQNGAIPSFQEAQSNDDRQKGLVLAETLAFVMTGVAWLVWVHRAHTNLDVLGARELRFTHGWAVGWHLVPLANLIRIPAVISELARASDPSGSAAEWKGLPAPPTIAAWWATYLVSALLREIAVLQRGTASIARLITGDKILLAGQVVSVLAAVLAIALVLEIVNGQRARATALGPS